MHQYVWCTGDCFSYMLVQLCLRVVEGDYFLRFSNLCKLFVTSEGHTPRQIHSVGVQPKEEGARGGA